PEHSSNFERSSFSSTVPGAVERSSRELCGCANLRARACGQKPKRSELPSFARGHSAAARTSEKSGVGIDCRDGTGSDQPVDSRGARPALRSGKENPPSRKGIRNGYGAGTAQQHGGEPVCEFSGRQSSGAEGSFHRSTVRYGESERSRRASACRFDPACCEGLCGGSLGDGTSDPAGPETIRSVSGAWTDISRSRGCERSGRSLRERSGVTASLGSSGCDDRKHLSR